MGPFLRVIATPPLVGLSSGRVGWELAWTLPASGGMDLKPAPDLGNPYDDGALSWNENGPVRGDNEGQAMQEVQIGGSIEDGGWAIVEAAVQSR